MKNCIQMRRGVVMLKTFLLACVLGVASMSKGIGHTGNVCDPLIRRYEAAHGIPHKLLTAISLVESGRKVQGSIVAWPWTINANGKPYVFATKGQAISMVRKLRQIGITSIDVGCMQVNLKQHPEAFSTLDAAFDPETNIAYAAKFLKAKQKNKGSWGHAVAHYHSATAKFHLPYKAKVLKTWAKVQNGKMTYREPLDIKKLTAEMILTDLERHKGEIVNNVATPSGRRVPMVVRFAPYRGFQKNTLQSPQLVNSGSNQRTGPKIIQGWLPKAFGRAIHRSSVNVVLQKPVSVENISVIKNSIPLSEKNKSDAKHHKDKVPSISKFHAKSR